jgi:hypothetical protein
MNSERTTRLNRVASCLEKSNDSLRPPHGQSQAESATVQLRRTGRSFFFRVVNRMRIRLRIQKAGAPLYEGVYDIRDAESFGAACIQAWTQLRERQLASVTSIGALYEELNDQLLDDLIGAEITLSKA